jgi:hypothetical protein
LGREVGVGVGDVGPTIQHEFPGPQSISLEEEYCTSQEEVGAHIWGGGQADVGDGVGAITVTSVSVVPVD